jgi:hypothetical protein
LREGLTTAMADRLEIRSMNQEYQSQANDDVAASATPKIVRTAGLLLVTAGAFSVLHVIQIFGVVVAIRGPFAFVPHVMAVVAVASLVAGFGLARARAWAPLPAISAASLLAITSGAWFLFAVANGLFTLFGMLVPGMASLATVLAALAKGPCERTAEARKQLERAGFELGV